MVERAARVLCAAAALGFASLALGHGHDCGLYSAECPLADLATRVAGAPLPDLGDGLPAASPVSRRVRTAAEAARPAPIFSASGCRAPPTALSLARRVPAFGGVRPSASGCAARVGPRPAGKG